MQLDFRDIEAIRSPTTNLVSSYLFPGHGWYNSLWVCLLLVRGAGLLLADDHSEPVTARHATCGLRQHGFHLALRCHLLGPPHAEWGKCLLKLRLHKGLFVDPYELASRQPHLNFTVAKPKSSDTRSSKIGRMFTWFLGDTDPAAAEDLPFEYHHQGETPMRHGDVDVEAPEWLSDPMTLNLALGWGDQVKYSVGPALAEIPVHMRYRLPSYPDDSSTLDTNILPAPMLNCNDGDDFIEKSATPIPLEYTIPRPTASDLFFVMPITILLLTVGVVVLLLA